MGPSKTLESWATHIFYITGKLGAAGNYLFSSSIAADTYNGGTKWSNTPLHQRGRSFSTGKCQQVTTRGHAGNRYPPSKPIGYCSTDWFVSGFLST